MKDEKLIYGNRKFPVKIMSLISHAEGSYQRKITNKPAEKSIHAVFETATEKCQILIYDCYEAKFVYLWSIDSRVAQAYLFGLKTLDRQNRNRLAIFTDRGRCIGQWSLDDNYLTHVCAALPAADFKYATAKKIKHEKAP